MSATLRDSFGLASAQGRAVPTMVRARGVVASLATNVVDATRDVGTTGELEIGED